MRPTRHGRAARAGRLTQAAGAALLLALPPAALAQGPPAPPDDPASAMFTLEAIYQRLTTGAPGARRGAGFVEPTTAPGTPGRSLDDLMAVCPVADDTLGASAGEVLAGRTFWGLRGDGWGPLTGTAAAQALSPASAEVPAGFYGATTLDAVDADLAAANLRAGVVLFGVAGDPDVVDTSSGTAAAGDLAAGRKAWVDGAEITGTVQAGTLSPASTAVAAGIYAATDLAAVDPDLVAANVRAGVVLFGVAGDPDVVDTSSGDATASDLALGKVAWVDGAPVTGTLVCPPPAPTPQPPTGLVVAACAGQAACAALGWSPPAQYDSFRVQRATGSGGTTPPASAFADVAADLATFSYQDTGLAAGVYWYRVATVVGGQSSSFGEPQSIAITGPAPPADVTVISCPGSPQCARVSWSPPLAYDGFAVQRATDLGTGSPPPDGAFADVAASVPAFQYDDATVTGGTLYWYRVATELGGQRGAFTAPVPILVPAVVGN